MRKRTIEDAEALMRSAHAGVVDRGGRPYENHVLRVAERTRRRLNQISDDILSPSTKDEIIIAALLHDVIEDTDHDKQSLLDLGYSERTIATVEAVTRLPEDGITYIDKIRKIASGDDLGAIIIKLCDNEDNADPDRIAALPEDQRSIVQRYERSMKILRTALRDRGFEALTFL